jgi:hypothetical protein
MSPTEQPPLKRESVGSREGETFVPGEGLAVLDSSVYQDMRWCPNCGGRQIFVVVYEFEGGRVGVCLGCGDERIAGFTRTTGEAA